MDPCPPLLLELKRSLAAETWRVLAQVILGVWLVAWLCASLHNQIIIRIAPEHFTVWHYPTPFIRDHTLLGFAYALAASFSPSMALGSTLYVAGRLFERPKLSPWEIVRGVFYVAAAVEVCALVAGVWTWRTGVGLYPAWVYPDDSPGLTITQTMQITGYLSGTFFSLVLVALTWRRRKPRLAGS